MSIKVLGLTASNNLTYFLTLKRTSLIRQLSLVLTQAADQSGVSLNDQKILILDILETVFFKLSFDFSRPTWEDENDKDESYSWDRLRYWAAENEDEADDELFRLIINTICDAEEKLYPIVFKSEIENPEQKLLNEIIFTFEFRPIRKY